MATKKPATRQKTVRKPKSAPKKTPKKASARPATQVAKKEPATKGRPSPYTPALAAGICGWVRQGYTLRQIAELPNMPAKSTIIEWLGKHEAFSDQYARAHELQALVMEDEIREIAEDGRNDWMEREAKDGTVELVPNEELISRRRLRIDTMKWLMEKKAPKRFGRQLAVTGKAGGPVQVEHLGSILEEIDGAGTGLPHRGRGK